jgi:RNA polymerase sigma-70 factor (ECF subfamily)
MELTLQNIINGCKQQERAAQKELYMRYVNTGMAICLRYVTNRVDAEEILNNAFLRIFKHIGQFDNKGSFDGWIKRIFANCCLTYIGKAQFTNHTKLVPLQNDYQDNLVLFSNPETGSSSSPTEEKYNKDYLLSLIRILPETTRLVFNLYVFEDYNHKEIGELLNMAERTSQAHLAKARNILSTELDKKKLIFKMQRV